MAKLFRLQRGEAAVALFTIAYVAGFTAWFLLRGNYEFVVYVVTMLVLIALVLHALVLLALLLLTQLLLVLVQFALLLFA